MNLSRRRVEEEFGSQVLERLDRDHREQCPYYSTTQAEIAKLDLGDEQAAKAARVAKATTKTSTYVERYSGGGPYGSFGLLRGGTRG